MGSLCLAPPSQTTSLPVAPPYRVAHPDDDENEVLKEASPWCRCVARRRCSPKAARDHHANAPDPPKDAVASEDGEPTVSRPLRTDAGAFEPAMQGSKERHGKPSRRA